MADVFISYANQEKACAIFLEETLSEHGWSVWRDASSVRAGRKYPQAIKQALEEARCVLVLWSEHSRASGWVSREAGYAYRMDKLLPVLVDDTGPPQKQRTTGWVDFQGWEQIQHLDFERESDEDMDRIAEGIRFLLEEDDLAELLYRYVEFHHGWSLVPGKIKEDAALYLRFEPIADERVSTIRATLEELCEEEYLDTDGSRFWYPR